MCKPCLAWIVHGKRVFFVFVSSKTIKRIIGHSRAIIQSGIKKIYVHEQFYRLSTSIHREKWLGHDDITMQMFDEAKVELIMLDLPHLKVDAYLDGLVYQLGSE